jgi:phage terminase large subunit GpA-like protein
MTNCKGLFGKLFGHKFEKFLIECKPTHMPDVKINGTLEIMERLFEFCSERKYEIRCKRCGCKTDE